MIRVNRKKTAFKKLTEEQDDYMHASYAKRVAFVWELTKEVWGLKDKKSVQRRLQRHVTKLIRNGRVISETK